MKFAVRQDDRRKGATEKIGNVFRNVANLIQAT